MINNNDEMLSQVIQKRFACERPISILSQMNYQMSILRTTCIGYK